MVNPQKKILFIIRSTGHFTYYQSIVDSLLQQNTAIKVLFNKGWSDNKSFKKLIKPYQNNKIIEFGWSKVRTGKWRNIIFLSREMRSYRRYLLINNQSGYYKERWRKYLPLPLSFIFKNKILNDNLKSRLVGLLLKSIEKLTASDKKILDDILAYSPSVVVAGPVNMRFSEEIEYIKAAKKLGIPTVVPVISWDNLTTKGLIQEIPEKLLVWNKTQQQEALSHHQIKNSKTSIIGSPFFDKWFISLKPSITKDSFSKKVGFKNRNPILLYLGSSSNIARDETWLIKNIRQILDASKNQSIRNINILIRPHPANTKIYQGVEQKNIKVFPKSGSLSTDKKQLQDFYDSLFHSFATIGINTSAMIDAAIIDKPIIAYMSDKYSKTQKEAVHFQQLLKSQTLYLAKSNQDLLNIIQKLITNKDKLSENRQQFVKDFIRPKGLKNSAGGLAAREIIKLT